VNYAWAVSVRLLPTAIDPLAAMEMCVDCSELHGLIGQMQGNQL